MSLEKSAERRNGQGEPQKRGEGGRRGHRRKTTLRQDRKISGPLSLQLPSWVFKETFSSMKWR